MSLSKQTRPKELRHLARADADAATNMALDLWMLESGKSGESGAIRVYGWTQPAVTFGFSQRWQSVKDHCRHLGEPLPRECIRRPTGGGVVDHRSDWTYALAFFHPAPLASERPQVIYDTVHHALARALASLGVESSLVPCDRTKCHLGAIKGTNPSAATQDSPPSLSVCFQQPVVGDLTGPSTGLKIAGAALKRTRHGVLLQGSVKAATLGEHADDKLEKAFIHEVSTLLEAEVTKDTLPPVHDLATTITQLSSETWNRRR